MAKNGVIRNNVLDKLTNMSYQKEMGAITLGPDISCSIWVDVGCLYYMIDKDTKSTTDFKYTCFVSFVPLGGGAAAAYCIDKVCPSYRLPISTGSGLSAWL